MLRLHGLVKRFGDVRALDGVAFDVSRGSMVGFVGRNGAGKTTAMRVVMGVARPDAGTVTWDGAAVDDAVRLRFGYMPEERGLYPKMRVRDQLVYFGRLSGLDRATATERADAWIERLGVAERAADPVDDLSLGNQQRVQLAAALVHTPDLLVLDEPFSGLDPVGVDVLAAALRQEADRGAAIVFSSHQLELVERLCDDVVIIEAGRIVTDADDELRAAERRTLVVEVGGAPPGWWDDLPGVELLREDGERVELQLATADDLDRVVDAARAHGSLRHLQVGARSLAERFRQAVDR